MTFKELVEKNRDTIISQAKAHFGDDIKYLWVVYNYYSDRACEEDFPDTMVVWVIDKDVSWFPDKNNKGIFWSAESCVSELDISLKGFLVISLKRESFSDINDLSNLKVKIKV